MKLPYCLPEVPLLIMYTAEFSPNYFNCSKYKNLFYMMPNMIEYILVIIQSKKHTSYLPLYH